MPSSSMSSQAGQFGPNEWLVEEMYQRFLDDPTAVDPAWHDFFADYRPEDGDTSPAATEGNGAQATVATEQPAPQEPVAEKEPSRAPAPTVFRSAPGQGAEMPPPDVRRRSRR